jgi:DNA-binding CsgD family transcriptional regulator
MGSAAAYARARETILRICRGESDARTLRLEALDAIRRAVGFDAYAWLLTDPETSVGSSPLADVPCLPRLPQLIRLKYATSVNRWTGLPSAAASLHRVTGGSLSLSLMWRELLGRYQVTDIASSVYRDRFGCWGFLDLWRIGAPAFTGADIEFLGHIAAPVTAALRRGLARTFIPATGGDQMPAGPVVLLLSPALEVRAQTPQTQRYLRILVPPDAEDQIPVPAGAYNVAAGGDIAVSIEPSTASDRVSVFARACGLTPRETELLQHLAGGAGTREVAGQMFVSENTVQDHLKSIFDKSSARSRRALLARALGT